MGYASIASNAVSRHISQTPSKTDWQKQQAKQAENAETKQCVLGSTALAADVAFEFRRKPVITYMHVGPRRQVTQLHSAPVRYIQLERKDCDDRLRSQLQSL